MRIGYVPYRDDLMAPGDRRRFCAYARLRNLSYEIADIREKYDLVILSELADITAWQDYRHGKVVFDLIDAYLSIPRWNTKQFLRGYAFYATGRHRRPGDYLSDLRAMCMRAAAVVCSTGEQAELIGKYCNNVRIILDIHDTVATRVKTDYRTAGPLRLVWEGLPSNLPQLKVLPKDIRERVAVITAPEWNEATLAKVITSYDVAVIPINLKDRLVSGKPENKLLLLWRMGMPVIVSATPSYARQMIAIGWDYMTVVGDDEWRCAVNYLRDLDRRRALGQAGLERSKLFGTEQMLERWDQLFQSLGFQFGRTDDEVADNQYSHLGVPVAGDRVGFGGSVAQGAADPA